MSTNILDLKQGSVYLIRHDLNKYRHFEGTFIESRTINGKLSPEFTNCVCYIRQVEHIDHYSDSDYCRSQYQSDQNPNHVFCDPIRTRYYDAVKVKTFDKVKNLQKATESRERRSVNMILKRLVNEEFEW
jgi:hypothetical protein